MGLDLARGSDTDPDAGCSNGGEGAEGGMGDHGEDWMDENWIVGQTVDKRR